MTKNTARKSCFGRPEHIDGLPETELLDKDEMFNYSEQAYHQQQADQYRQHQQYPQHQRNFPPSNYGRKQFYENKENKNDPQSLGYYLSERRGSNSGNSWSPDRQRRSYSPRNKPRYDSRGREEEHRRRSSPHRARSRSPRDYASNSPRSFHSRSPRHHSSKSPRCNSSRSSSRHRLSKSSSARPRKRSRERDKRHRSRSSSVSESASESSVSGTKMSPRNKQRHDKYQTTERGHSTEQRSKKSVSSVVRKVENNHDKNNHYLYESKQPSKNHCLLIHKKFKKEETMGGDMTIGELSMSPISSEDFSQRSEEAESDGEKEESDKTSLPDSKTDSISSVKKEENDSSEKTNIDSQNQEKCRYSGQLEELQIKKQNPQNNVGHLSFGVKETIKDKTVKQREEKRSSREHLKVEKRLPTLKDNLEGNSDRNTSQSKNSTKRKDTNGSDTDNRTKDEKCFNSDKTGGISKERTVNVEEEKITDHTVSDHSAAENVTKEMRKNINESFKEDDLAQSKGSMVKLENTLLKTNRMPKEMVSKIMSLMTSSKAKNNNELQTLSNNDQSKEDKEPDIEEQKESFRDEKAKNNNNELEKAEGKINDEQQNETTKTTEAHAEHSVGDNSKKYKSKKERSNELNEKLTVEPQREKLKTEKRKEYSHSKDTKEDPNTKSKVSENEVLQHEKKNSETFKQEKMKERNAVVFAEQDRERDFGQTIHIHLSQENAKSRPDSTEMKESPPPYTSQSSIQNKNYYFSGGPSCASASLRPQSDLVNTRQGQKISLNSGGSSSSSHQKSFSSKSDKEKSRQAPTNLDQSRSHTLSVKDKKKCFEACIKAKEGDDSCRKSDAKKNERFIKDIDTNAEPFRDKQEGNSNILQENLDGRNAPLIFDSLKKVSQNTRERRCSGATDVPQNRRERKRSGAVDMLQSARERNHSGPAEADLASTRMHHVGESAPAIVKGTMNRPSGDVFIPLGRPSEKKRKLSPYSQAPGRAHPASSNETTEPSFPVTEGQGSVNKFEEASANETMDDCSEENSGFGTKRSLFSKNKKRISHYNKNVNSPIVNGQSKSSEMTSPEANTKTDPFKKLSVKRTAGSSCKEKSQDMELNSGKRNTSEYTSNATSQNTPCNKIEITEVKVILSPIDNIFEKMRENTVKETEQKIPSGKNIVTGVKRSHAEKFTHKNTNEKRRRYEEVNIDEDSSFKEKTEDTLKECNESKNIKDKNHNQKSTLGLEKCETGTDEKIKSAKSSLQRKMHKNTYSRTESRESKGSEKLEVDELGSEKLKESFDDSKTSEKNTFHALNINKRLQSQKMEVEGKISESCSKSDSNKPENVKDIKHNQKSTSGLKKSKTRGDAKIVSVKSNKLRRTHKNANPVTEKCENFGAPPESQTSVSVEKNKTSGDEKVKAAKSSKQTKTHKNTNSMTELRETSGVTPESKTSVSVGAFRESKTGVQFRESHDSKAGVQEGKADELDTNEKLEKKFESKTSEKFSFHESNIYEKIESQKLEAEGKLSESSKSDGNIQQTRYQNASVKLKESSESKYDKVAQMRQSPKPETKQKLPESIKSIEDDKSMHAQVQEDSSLHKKEQLVQEKYHGKIPERAAKSCDDLIVTDTSFDTEKAHENANIDNNPRKEINCDSNGKVSKIATNPSDDLSVAETMADDEKENAKNDDKHMEDIEMPIFFEKNDTCINRGVMNETVHGMDTEAEKYQNDAKYVESENDDAESDIGDIEPIQMIGSVFINDVCIDEPVENIMDSNIDVENGKIDNVQIKYCDDRLVLQNSDTSDKKETVLREKKENTTVKIKTTPRKKFAPQLESLGKLIEDDKDIDDCESKEETAHTLMEQTTTKNTESGVSEEEDDDDDTELISSGVELTPTKEKPSTTTSQWLEKAKNKVKVPESLIKAKKKENAETPSAVDEDDFDIIPNIPEHQGPFNKKIFEKGFDVCHTKRLKNGDFIKTLAHLQPRRLYRTSNTQEKNLGKCLLCQSCSMYFSPLAFTYHHDTRGIVEHIVTEKSSLQNYSLIEKGDVDTIRIFRDFISYFHAERNNRCGASPVKLPRTVTPTVEDNGLSSEDTDLPDAQQVLQKDTATTATVTPVQSETKSKINSDQGVKTASKDNVQIRQQLNWTSANELRKTHTLAEQFPSLVNQISGGQPGQTPVSQVTPRVNQPSGETHQISGDHIGQKNTPVPLITSQVNQTSGDQPRLTHQTPVPLVTSPVNQTSGHQPVLTHQTPMPLVTPPVNQTSGPQPKQTHQTSGQKYLSTVDRIPGHKQKKDQQNVVQQSQSQVNQTQGFQLWQTQHTSRQQFTPRVKYTSDDQRRQNQTSLQYQPHVNHSLGNQFAQVNQTPGHQFLSQMQPTDEQATRIQVNQFEPQLNQTPGASSWQQMHQKMNHGVPIQAATQQQSARNSCPREQHRFNPNTGSFSVTPQQAPKRVALSSENVGTVPMFNPLTAQLMDPNMYPKKQPVNRSDYTGIPFASTQPVGVPNSTHISQQSSRQTSSATTQNMNYNMAMDQSEMSGVQEPARPRGSAQTRESAAQQNMDVSRQMCSEGQTFINAAAIEEERRRLLQRLLGLEDIRSGDIGLDLILLGRKYVQRGLATVNQEVLRMYRERSATAMNQQHIQPSQQNGRPMTVEERVYYMGQLRSNQQ